MKIAHSDQHVLNVLLLGFSVTGAGDGYAYRLASMGVTAGGFKFTPIGVGGMHPFAIPFLFQYIDTESFDIVIFEIFTSDCREWSNKERLRFAVVALIEICRSRGIVPIFLRLFRQDVDYQKDFFWDQAVKDCEKKQCRCIDITEFFIANPAVLKDLEFFKDEVHAGQKSTEIYAREVLNYLESNKSNLADEVSFAGLPLEAKIFDFRAIEFDLNENLRSFSRTGLTLNLKRITQEPTSLYIDEFNFLHGICYLMGPTTSEILIMNDSQILERVQTFDQHSYYERIHSVEFDAVKVDKITLLQSGDKPKVQLLKGSRAEGRPIDYVACVFCSKDSIENMIERLNSMDSSRIRNKEEGKIPMLEGDYVSSNLASLDIDHAFPNMISGLPPDSPWAWWEPGLVEGYSHRWYADKRVEAVGFATRDEANYMHACAKLMQGKRALEIGCFMGWTACHIASGGVRLDVLDPWLDGFVGESVRTSLATLGLESSVNLIQDSSPNGVVKLGRQLDEKWSLALIDGDHGAPLPLADAVTVAEFMASDAIIIFHDVNLPAVGKALDGMQFLGWNTRVLHTTFGLGVAWRGNIEPPLHIPDPTKQWKQLSHLHSHSFFEADYAKAGIISPPPLAPLGNEIFTRLHAKCAPYSATSVERMQNLFDMVQYVARERIEGCLVECGVWRGGSIMLMCETLSVLGESDRKVFAFDTFSGMSDPTVEDQTIGGESASDLMEKEINEKETGVWCLANLEDVKRNVGTVNYPSDNISFVKGLVEETTPTPMLEKIALLRLDTDFYASTKHELEVIVPLVSKGGVVIIDDYGHWLGCRKAVDEWIDEKSREGVEIKLQEIDFTGRYFIQP